MQLQAALCCTQHDFYNVIFKIKHKYKAAGPVLPQGKMLGAHLAHGVQFGTKLHVTDTYNKNTLNMESTNICLSVTNFRRSPGCR
jgi:hypothetical protein